MERFKEARDRGGAFLLTQQRADGSFDGSVSGPGDYFGAPIALQVSGHSTEASRLLDWVRDSSMTAEGDFGPRPPEAPHFYHYAYPYFNSWLIVGAHRMGRFDLSHRGIDFMLRFWDAESGGFYSSPTERSADTKQDLWVTAGCGRAALYTGRLDVARGVGRWMDVLMKAQPSYPQQMYTVYSRAEGLHTVPDPDNEIRYVVNRDAEQDQFFFHPGIAGAFLARLYQATSEERWLELSREYMRFAEGASDFLFGLARAGKVGWAASLLYTITGERKYRDIAVRVGDRLIGLQSEQGYWSWPGQGGPGIDITAELTIWMDEIYQAVGHEEPSPSSRAAEAVSSTD